MEESTITEKVQELGIIAIEENYGELIPGRYWPIDVHSCGIRILQEVYLESTHKSALFYIDGTIKPDNTIFVFSFHKNWWN